MSGTLILHDTRLEGMADNRTADRVETVDGGTVLEAALMRVGDFANGHGGLDQLSIMCHGYEMVHNSPSQQVCLMIGGGGLQLCREGLTRGTVAKTEVLKGLVNEILVYACAAADTHPDMVGTTWDGRDLFSRMAVHTGAVVYAADVTQWYWRIHDAVPNACSDYIDFRGWEGNVWRFNPDGRSPVIVESNPITAR